MVTGLADQGKLNCTRDEVYTHGYQQGNGDSVRPSTKISQRLPLNKMGGSRQPHTGADDGYPLHLTPHIPAAATPINSPNANSVKGSYPEQNHGVGAKWVKHLYQDRLGTFLGGHYNDVNLSHALFTERIDSKDYVKLLVWSAPGRSKPSFKEAIKQAEEDGWKVAKKGDSFGPSCEFTGLAFSYQCCQPY